LKQGVLLLETVLDKGYGLSVGSVRPTLHSPLFTHCCHNNGHFLFFPVYLGQENKICSGKGDVPLGKEDYG
ncbi:hypothetical protein, partial [Acidaminococcus fermentans]|uniref:hypothetical protein n=1 Tax=Acidaminococcus fermentans TaxID=905 RepID=UPI0039F4D0E1